MSLDNTHGTSRQTPVGPPGVPTPAKHSAASAPGPAPCDDPHAWPGWRLSISARGWGQLSRGSNTHTEKGAGLGLSQTTARFMPWATGSEPQTRTERGCRSWMFRLQGCVWWSRTGRKRQQTDWGSSGSATSEQVTLSFLLNQMGGILSSTGLQQGVSVERTETARSLPSLLFLPPSRGPTPAHWRRQGRGRLSGHQQRLTRGSSLAFQTQFPRRTLSLCLRARTLKAVKCSEIYEAPDEYRSFLLLLLSLFWHFPNMT